MTYYSDDIAIFNKERALFLKELSLTPLCDVNSLSVKLSIPQDRIWGYLKGFLALIAESSIDSDYIRVRDSINHGVELEYQIEDGEIRKLVPLVEKYGDTEIIERFKRGREEAEARLHQPQSLQQPHITHEEAAGQPRDLNPNDAATLNRSASPTMNTSGEAPVFDYGTWNVEVLNKGYNYSFFSELNRIGLMRWTLQNLAIPPRPTTVESWMRYFELNQDTLMSDPMHLRQKLKDWFGEKTGEQASELFNSYIKYLKPHEQFGIRKLEGMRGDSGMFQTEQMNPMFNGMRFTDPFNTYYHQEGVLPFGMDARAGDATRLIREFEQEKRRKKDAQGKRDELLEDIRTKIQMDMTSFLDRSHGGGNGNGMGGGQSMDQMYLPLVLSGQMKMIPYTNQDGKTEYRYEVVDRSTLPVNQDPNALTARDMLEYMKGMYDLILQERTSKNQVGETLMDRIVARALPEQSKSPVLELMENWKALKEVSQPAGGWGGQMSQTLDAARIMLERDKFVADKERSEKLIDRQFDSKAEQAKIELEREKQANETKNLLIKNVGSAVTSSLPTLFQLILMLTGKGGSLAGAGGAPGGGGLMNLIGNLLGGGAGGLSNLLGGANNQQDEDEEELLPPIGKGTGGQGSATSGGSGSSMGDIMGQMSGLFGNLFGGQQAQAPVQSQQQQQQQYRPDQFVGINAPVAHPPTGSYSTANEAMRARNPTGYQGVFNEVQQKTAGPPDQAVVMPASDFNPYVHAGMQPQPRQIPVPDTNRDDVYQSQYAQVLNTSYLAGNPFPPQQQHVHHEAMHVHPMQQPQPQQQQQPNQMIEIQREEESNEDDYRTYSPDDFSKLSPSQLDEAYQKGQASKQSIDSYLNSVESRRNAILKQQPDINQNQNQNQNKQENKEE